MHGIAMATAVYQMLFGDSAGKLSDNLTSVFLVASVITLALGYLSKMLLQHPSSSSDLVSCGFYAEICLAT